MPAPEAERPPAAPGPGATPYHCRCGNLLGILDRRWLFSRHRGRGVDATLPARVRCEACGRARVLLPGAPTDGRPAPDEARRPAD